MNRLIIIIALFIAGFSMNYMSLAQTVSARDQCLKLGRGLTSSDMIKHSGKTMKKDGSRRLTLK